MECIGLSLTLSLCVQAADLPRDVWANIRQHMNTKEWGKACGVCRASFALRPILTAAVRSDPSIDWQAFLRELEVDNWCACQSLCLNLRQLQRAAILTAAQIKHIKQFDKAVHCLHIRGRSQVPLKESSIEGVLMSLARHTPALILHVKTLKMPLQLPDLQHMVLGLGESSGKGGGERMHREVFQSISLLTGLKTLYVQSVHAIIKGHADLRSCVHLQKVALVDVYLEGLVALPTGCCLHTICEPKRIEGVTLSFRDLVTGLTLRHTSSRKLSIYPCKQVLNGVLLLKSLKRLQLILSKEDLKGYSMSGAHGDFELEFGLCDLPARKMPSLQVLELHVDSDVKICVGSALPLRALVVVTTGALELTFIRETGYPPVYDLSHKSMPTLKHMYLQAGAVFPPIYKHYLETSATAQVSFVDHVKEKRWTAQMPADLQPSDPRLLQYMS